MKLSLFMFISNIFYVDKENNRTVWNNGIGKYDMLNLYPRSIGVVPGINTSIILVQCRYVGIV